MTHCTIVQPLRGVHPTRRFHEEMLIRGSVSKCWEFDLGVSGKTSESGRDTLCKCEATRQSSL